MPAVIVEPRSPLSSGSHNPTARVVKLGHEIADQITQRIEFLARAVDTGLLKSRDLAAEAPGVVLEAADHDIKPLDLRYGIFGRAMHRLLGAGTPAESSKRVAARGHTLAEIGHTVRAVDIEKAMYGLGGLRQLGDVSPVLLQVVKRRGRLQQGRFR